MYGPLAAAYHCEIHPSSIATFAESSTVGSGLTYTLEKDFFTTSRAAPSATGRKPSYTMQLLRGLGSTVLRQNPMFAAVDDAGTCGIARRWQRLTRRSVGWSTQS